MDKHTCRKYFREAKKHLYCNTTQRKAFEQKILAAVEDLKGENPNISDIECFEIIGTPKEAAQSFLEEFSQEFIQNQIKRQKRMRYFSIAAGVVFTIFLAIIIAFLCLREFTVVEVSTTIIDWRDKDISDLPNLLH